MLGTRTKQVFSYGKRNQRIVNISDERERLKKNPSTSIFDGLAPAPQWAPVVSKMKKRENIIPIKGKSPSPKIIRVTKKKRLSPVLSPAQKRRTRVGQIMDAETVHKHELPIAPSKPKAGGPRLAPAITDTISTPRAPLAVFPLNVAGSPAVSGKIRKKAKVTTAKGTPLRLKKPFSPFVDMDIIVLDDEGRTVSKERRVSRSDIQTNDVGSSFSKGKVTQDIRKHEVIDLVESSESDAESVLIPQPKPPKRLARKVQPKRVYSDDSDSDDGHVPHVDSSIPPGLKAKAPKKPKSSTPTSTEVFAPKPLQARPSRLQVEVVVPPLPLPPPCVAPPRDSSPSLYLPPSQALHTQPTRYQHFPSPVARPRQLTPIRGARGRRPFEPPSPPSPTTPTDLDLSLEFSSLDINLGLSASHQRASSFQSQPEFPRYLLPLLTECHQETCGLHEFSAFIESFPFDPIVQPADGDTSSPSDVRFRKIGEASYSEVFGIGDVVLKVIPLRDEDIGDASGNSNKLKMNAKYNEDGEQEDGPAPSDAKDVLKEIIVTRAMGEVCEGFVKLLRTYIVRGRYPEVLLELWDEYFERKGSESVRPDTFNVSQTYAIIVLPNGGPDLEAYTFTAASKTGWRQACSIFWQVSKALAHAEQLVSFEHRDLHWGQILVKNTGPPPLTVQNQNQKPKSKATARIMMDDLSHGVRATLIDLGLSRMDAGDGDGGERVHWTPFDDEIFMGEGDYQFDVYRIMRDHNGGAWEEFKPLTNVIWLHYLALKLLHSKRLKAPPSPRRGLVPAAAPSATATFTERDCYDSLIEVEKLLSKSVAVVRLTKVKVPSKGKGRRKTDALAQAKLEGPLCAGEVVGFGIKKGWVKPVA